MNYLGIDYGEKRIGLSTGSDETNIASPAGVLENKGENFILKEIKRICNEDNIGIIVVGVPLTLKGGVGRQAKKIFQFTSFLKKNLNVPVETEDERMTSVMVDKLMIESGVRERDAVAAMIILQSYLDRK